jgi:hypothetical protein
VLRVGIPARSAAGSDIAAPELEMRAHLWNVVVALALSFVPPQRSSEVPISSGTGVRLRLTQFVSSEKSRPGDSVAFKVARDVVVDHVVVIRAGAAAVGRITEAKPHRSRWWLAYDSLGGELALAATATTAVDGTLIRLRLADDTQHSNAGPLIKWQVEGKLLDSLVEGDYAIKTSF